MFYIIKHIKARVLLRQVADAYKNETGKDKSALLTRRFIGALVTSSGAIATLYTGIDIDAGMIAGMEEHLSKVADTGYQIYLLFKSIIPDIVAIWGIIMVIVGYFKREKKLIQ